MALPPADPHEETKEWVTYCGGHSLMVGDVDWNKASLPTPVYNCMGLAMHKACGFLEWWQPPEIETNVVLAKWYWPDGVVCHGGIDAYIQAAVSVGFEETSNPNWEGSAEKVILYYLEDAQKTFKHAAICESPNVCWSKIGRFSDISHRPIALDDVIKFGSGRVYLARRLK